MLALAAVPVYQNGFGTGGELYHEKPVEASSDSFLALISRQSSGSEEPPAEEKAAAFKPATRPANGTRSPGDRLPGDRLPGDRLATASSEGASPDAASDASSAARSSSARFAGTRPAPGTDTLNSGPGGRSARAGGSATFPNRNPMSAPERAATRGAAPDTSSKARGADRDAERKINPQTREPESAPHPASAAPGHPAAAQHKSGVAAETGRARIRAGRGPSDGDEASLLAGPAAMSAEAARLALNGASARSPKTGAATDALNGGLDTENARTRKTDGRDGARVRVIDMRLKAAREGASANAPESEKAGGAASDARPERAAQDSGLSLQAGFTEGSGAGPEPAALARADTPARAHTFADSLASRLRDGAGDIVRSAQVVLRDGDAGIIRLRLEPESLGGVKIELKMAEKQISGKIIVESDIAGEAFRASLDALKDAFAAGGFETSSLEVEVRNGMASGSGGAGGENGGGDGPYWSRSLRELEAAVPEFGRAGRDGLLDMTI